MAGTTDFNAHSFAEFRAHHGQVGGNFAGAPLLLLHTVGAERDVNYAEQARRYPGLAAYQRRTERIIPVNALIPTGGHAASADNAEGTPA